jgi:hypothetical protein
MVTVILAFDEADYGEADIYHYLTAYQHRAAEPQGLRLGQRQAGKVASMGKRDLTVSFEDSNEGKVFLAMKRGVLEWVSEVIKSRLDEEEPLNVAANYVDAVAALNEIDRQQDAEIGAAADPDQDIE